MRKPVTSRPSVESRARGRRRRGTSQAPPTANVTTSTGRKYRAPWTWRQEQGGGIRNKGQREGLPWRAVLPGVQGKGTAVDGQVGLIARVVHGHDHRTDQGDDDQPHHSFEIDAVADVGQAPRPVGRRVQEGVGRLVERIEALEPAARVKMAGPRLSRARRPSISLRSPARSGPREEARRTRSCPSRRTCTGPGLPHRVRGSRVPRPARRRGSAGP